MYVIQSEQDVLQLSKGDKPNAIAIENKHGLHLQMAMTRAQLRSVSTEGARDDDHDNSDEIEISGMQFKPSQGNMLMGMVNVGSNHNIDTENWIMIQPQGRLMVKI